jgi:hypothetical protein
MFTSLIALYFVLDLLDYQETTNSTFDDLGKLLLGGVAAALIAAVGFTIIRLRIRDKRPPSTNFISISSPQDKD